MVKDRHKLADLPKIMNHLSNSEAHVRLPAEVWLDLSDPFDFKPSGPSGESYAGRFSAYGTLQASSCAVVAAGRTELWDMRGYTCAVEMSRVQYKIDPFELDNFSRWGIIIVFLCS